MKEIQEQVLFSIIDTGHNRVVAKYMMKIDVSSILPELKAKVDLALEKEEKAIAEEKQKRQNYM